MKNIRRIPFIVVSIGQALVLVFVSLLYVFQVKEYSLLNGLRAVDGLYILVGVEMMIVEPCLIYYIGERENLSVLELQTSLELENIIMPNTSYSVHSGTTL